MQMRRKTVSEVLKTNGTIKVIPRCGHAGKRFREVNSINGTQGKKLQENPRKFRENNLPTTT
jgi:hypothetical protein